MNLSMPQRAAERLVLNPHSFPHPPAGLVRVIAHNRQQAQRSSWAHAAYLRRRSSWDTARLARGTALADAAGAAGLPEQAVADSDDEDAAAPATLAHSLTAPAGAAADAPGDAAGGAAGGAAALAITTDTLGALSARPAHASPLPHHRRRQLSIYEAPFMADLPEIAALAAPFAATPFAAAASFAATPFGAPSAPPLAESPATTPAAPAAEPRRRRMSSFSSLHAVANPEERLRLRCSTFKHRAGLYARRASAGPLDAHPRWHARMRDEYRRLGIEDVWRAERVAFLQRSRRDRTFAALAKRRMSA